MGYLHRWNHKNKEFFSGEFLKDVREIIMDYRNILKDVHVSSEYIQFNGIGDKGCETFVLHRENYYNSVKTGTFDVAQYDIVVSSVLLVLKYHYTATEFHSDGLMTSSVNKETLQVNIYWEKAFDYVKSKFGYEFNRELSHDEFEQEIILLKPRSVVVSVETD